MSESITTPNDSSSHGESIQYDIEIESEDLTAQANQEGVNRARQDKMVILRRKGAEEKLKIGLFDPKRARKVLLEQILAVGKKDNIQLLATSFAVYTLTQALTELQYDKQIKIISMKNLTNQDQQQALVEIALL